VTVPAYPLLVVEAPVEDVDALVGRLTLLGAEGIEERDQTTLARGGELGATLIASFPDEASREEAYEALRGEFPVRREELVGDAWRDAWKEHWRPTRITPRVVVVPSWTTYEPQPGDLVLPLDPGRAFGTGQHPSTALAARAIERAIEAGERATLLDLGCGSGILSFIAVMLGLPRAVACDIDDESIVAARENAEHLHLSDRVDLRVGGFDVVPETSPFVVANIEASVLVPHAAAVAAHVAPGGRLILSGILVEQRDDVVRAYAPLGFTLDRADVEGAWVAPELRRA
jgi:ribosomal protein L11 methyltransferase